MLSEKAVMVTATKDWCTER